ncbi:MAG: alpha/beta hydrolase [Oscillospiraceae bacterium]|nr:alpha/beta hydrolase [Oscillospiraceae bacterium]
MEYFSIKKPDLNCVSCVKEIPENPRGIIIAVHGFTSDRDCSTYQMLLRRMPQAGYGVVGIELPGHGTAESSRETLRVESCKNNIAAAEDYIKRNYPKAEVCYFASSFGAYITALYMTTREHAGKKAFFRSAAVNMPTLIVKEHPNEDELRKLRKLREQGYYVEYLDNLGRPVKITIEMYRDLETTDLFEIFDPADNRFAMAHGAEDEIINPNAAIEFATKFRIPLTLFEGEGHSLSGVAEQVADLAIELYNG